MSALRRQAPWIGSLTVIWVLLNGEPSVANIVGGLLVSTLVMLAFPLEPAVTGHSVHPLAVARLAAAVAWNLVTSSAQVVVTVLAPTPARLRAGIVRVELPGATPLITTLVANTITLTPGTLTVTAGSDPAVLHVHALGLGDLDEFRRSIGTLQEKVTAAFTPKDQEPTETRRSAS